MLPNVVLFAGVDSSGDTELWETNGTAGGTFELPAIAGTYAFGLGPVNLKFYNSDKVLFGGADSSGDAGLWVTNGTASGTYELTGIAGAATTAEGLSGLNPSDLTNYNGEMLFSGYDASGGVGLWVTNGTAAGTHELVVAGALRTPKEVFSPRLNPSNLTVYSGYVFFAGVDASGDLGLWETDGTASGTHELSGIVGVATTGFVPGLTPYDLTVFNDQILFSGNDARGQTGLWESNGTAAGTHELTGIAGALNSGTGLDPRDLTVFNLEMLFNGMDSKGLFGLWETNGTAAGTHELSVSGANTTGVGLDPLNLTDFNGEILFSGYDAGGGVGLWATNGTAAGTHELNDIAGAQTRGVGLSPADFTVYNGQALFSGYDSSGHLGLWVTDGTAPGTHELAGVAGASTNGLTPSDLTAISSGPGLTAGASVNDVAGVAPATLDAGIAVSDAEAVSLTAATVTISAGFLSGDELSVTSPQSGITSSYNSASGVLTLSGSASLAAYQAELGSVAFFANNAVNPSRTISWSVNDGVATSAPVTSTVSVSSDPNSSLCVMLQNTDGQLAWWQLNGTTLSTAELIGPNAGASWVEKATGTFFSGDTSDILLQNANGAVAVWQVQNDAFASSDLVANPGANWHVKATGDFTSDGHAAVLLQNANGAVAIWKMNGATISKSVVVANPGPNWHVEGTGDLNNDGQRDIVLQNANGSVAIWEMNGDTISQSNVIADPGPRWHVVGTGDLYGDGKSDIVLQNNNGAVAVWDMDGATISQSGIIANPGPNWHVEATGDFTSDGKTDLVLQNNNGAVAVWDMEGANISQSGVLANPGPTWSVRS